MPDAQGRLTEQEQQILHDFERGRLLADVLRSAGWNTLLDLMEKRVQQAEFQLINYNGSDKDLLLLLQRKARDFREFFQCTQTDALAAVEAAKETPMVISGQVPKEPWEI